MEATVRQSKDHSLTQGDMGPPQRVWNRDSDPSRVFHSSLWSYETGFPLGQKWGMRERS